jgi:hypothetical protein
VYIEVSKFLKEFTVNSNRIQALSRSLLTLAVAFSTFSHSVSAQDNVSLEKGTTALSPAAQLALKPAALSTAEPNVVTATLLFEDFETGATGWTQDGSWQVGAPVAGPGAGFGSANAVGTNLTGDYSDSVDESLVSPEILIPSLTVSESVHLRFDEYYELEDSFDFGLIEASTDGGLTWATLLSTRTASTGGGWLQGDISLDQFSGQALTLRFRLTTDDEDTFSGWYLDNISITTETPATTSASLRTINSQAFPFIFTDVDFTSTENACTLPVSNDDFTITEDGVVQQILTFVPPDEGGGIRLADVVFVFDNSGSMANEQAAVEANIIDFVDGLAASGVDFALGLTRYGQLDSSGTPIIEDSGILTTDANYFKDSVLPRNVINGGLEPGYLAIQSTAESFAYRPGSQRVIVIITDETADQGGATIEEAAQALAQTDAQLFAVTSQSLFPDFEPLVEDTSVQLIDILSPFDVILDEIVSDISSTYRVSYETTNNVLDGVARTVEVSIACGSETAVASGSYTPGGAPAIALTADTINTNNVAQIDGQSIAISVNVTDLVEPFVSDVQLFYRSLGGSFASVAMTLTTGSTYTAEIPAAVVVEPGVEYYVTATDGEVSSSLPTVDPISSPFQIAVLPNEVPLIDHTPIVEAQPNAPISVFADVEDTTNVVASVELFYRKTGDLTYESVAMSNVGGDDYSATIPQEVVTELGVQYFITAVDDLGVSASIGFADAPLEVIVMDVNFPSCDLDGNGLFERDDTTLFRFTCARGEPTFTCDLNNNGRYDFGDAIVFRVNCFNM